MALLLSLVADPIEMVGEINPTPKTASDYGPSMSLPTLTTESGKT